MKTHAFALILLICTFAFGVHPNSVVSKAAEPLEPPAAYTAVDTVIRVYFVSGMFSAEQRKALWDAMQSWKLSRKTADAQVTFVDLGETNGVIDCRSCLTVAREEILTSNRKWRSSFNRLRQDHTGRLLSAWIGLDRNTNTTAGLRELMLKALERGLGQA